MAFVDEITIKAKAGKGGDGVVRWLHLRGKEFGGPSGGNGGRGGDVVIRGVRDLNILTRYKGQSTFKAENGHDGFKNEMEGKNGTTLYMDVPVGSKITNTQLNTSWEILEEGEEQIVFKGGKGGLGNATFKSSTNQYPEQATKGEVGEEGSLFIEVQLIADVGLVGLPNAGKSSLLNVFTRKSVKVSHYAFTTLEPSLGVLFNYVVADIPGLIEGAAEGKGLGHKFLRHIKRTKVLLHCVSAEHENVKEAYEIIRSELSRYDDDFKQKPEIVFLTKVDEIGESEMLEKIELLKTCADTVVPVSILDDQLLKKAQDTLVQFLDAYSK